MKLNGQHLLVAGSVAFWVVGPACGGKARSGADGVAFDAGAGGSTGTGGRKATGGAGGTGGVVGAGGLVGPGGVVGEGGAHATGGASGSGGTASGGSGGELDAGSPEPCSAGNPCDNEGDRCTPPSECCPCEYVCQSGVWQVSSCPSCPQPICHDEPEPGTACGPCDELVSPCWYDECDGRGRIKAVCEDSTWKVTTEPCVTCLGVSEDGGRGVCPPGFVCVRESTFTYSESCQPNPCGDAPLSCDCAADLCTAGACVTADSNSVECVCFSC